MAARVTHTDVISVDKDLQSSVPSCPHGPCLLFERYNKADKDVRTFFACSAFRDRKACSFFRWTDSVKQSGVSSQSDETASHETHKNQRKRYFAFKKLPAAERHVCCTCGCLLLPDELSKHKSQGHVIKEKIKLEALHGPSHLFVPLADNKTFAQYLFAKNTVNFIINSLSSKFTHLLCIGTPRIHEMIQRLKKEKKTTLNSFLLDLDQRYGQLYPPQLYAKYNMFNNHFFEEDGRAHLLDFLRGGKKKIVFLMDPPFGGMVEPLALTLSKLSEMCETCNGTAVGNLNSQDGAGKRTCATPFLFFLPYFMEKRVLDSLTSVMLDYKVEYDNHDLYKNSAKKKGSPVRMFVHNNFASLQLPIEEGYWWCKPCKRYSSAENQHCTDCNVCTSKDGTSYVHCDTCQRCVKPSKKHCFTCNICQAQDHSCDTVKVEGCYICGELDHKKRDCPQKRKQVQNTKRPGNLKRKAEAEKGGRAKRRNKSKH